MSDPSDDDSPSRCGGARRSVAALAGAACLLAALAGLLWWQNPAGSPVYPPCPFRWLTGLRCAGCGTLRALHQLLHGNLAAAFFLNPLSVVALPPLTVWALWRTGTRLGLIQRRARPLPPWVIWSIFWLVLGFWVLRNLPWAPFRWFAA